MNNELLPCPLCGSEHFAPEVKQKDGAWSVNCYARTEGGCGLHLDGFVTKESAIKAWNTRADKAVPKGWKLVPIVMLEWMINEEGNRK